MGSSAVNIPSPEARPDLYQFDACHQHENARAPGCTSPGARGTAASATEHYGAVVQPQPQSSKKADWPSGQVKRMAAHRSGSCET